MMRHFGNGIVLLFLVVMILVPSRLMAGGWTVVTLDELPLNAEAGQPFALGFVVRQHGVKPVDLNLNEAPVLVTFRHPASGEQIQFEARKEGDVGHYVVEVTLPTATTWELEIRPSLFPAISVAPIEVHPNDVYWGQTAANGSLSQAWILGALALILLAGLWRLRSGHEPQRWPVGAMGALLVVSFLMVGWILSSRAAPIESPTIDQVAYGQVLFLAKGCAGCHTHESVTESSQLGSGPNLTGSTVHAEYVRQWLANPQAVKADTTMPNLQLSTAEIDALVLFLESRNNDATN
ncbi:MAG: c-type cytochrome [Caldilineaceae bacterium]|nr:c-type cytochrome [Caldilineaceae bacterium]MCB9156719.1 c-type cytochrome [Caldilineaceae bacterium]